MTWRALEASQAPALADLLAAVEKWEAVPYRTSTQEVESVFLRDTPWVGVAGFDSAQPERMIAFSLVSMQADNSGVVQCQGGVHPAMRSAGIGTELLSWQTQAGAKLVRSASPASPGYLTHTVHEKNAEFLTTLGYLGYLWQNSAVELRIPLDRWQSQSAPPPFLKILQWTEEWDNPTRRAFNAANSEFNAGPHLGKVAWKQMHADLRRDWSFVAVNEEGDRPRVVGFISAAGYDQDWEALGWTEGSLQVVAAFDPNDRPEIVSALLDCSVAAMKADEIQKVSVALDPDENPDALKFYQSRGFEVSSWFHTYRLELQD